MLCYINERRLFSLFHYRAGGMRILIFVTRGYNHHYDLQPTTVQLPIRSLFPWVQWIYLLEYSIHSLIQLLYPLVQCIYLLERSVHSLIWYLYQRCNVFTCQNVLYTRWYDLYTHWCNVFTCKNVLNTHWYNPYTHWCNVFTCMQERFVHSLICSLYPIGAMYLHARTFYTLADTILYPFAYYF